MRQISTDDNLHISVYPSLPTYTLHTEDKTRLHVLSI